MARFKVFEFGSFELFDQISIWANSGSRRAVEEPRKRKKGKSSKFNGKNDSQVESSPAVEGFLFVSQKSPWLKMRVVQGT